MKFVSVGGIASMIAVPLVYAILRALYPVDSAAVNSETQRVLQHKYGSWVAASTLIWLLLLTPALTWAFNVAFMRLAQHYVGGRGAFHVVITPHWLYWSFASFFVAMLSGAVIVDLVFRIVLRRDYAEFVHFQEMQAGFSAQAQWSVMSILTALCAVCVTLLLNWYVALSGETLVINRMWTSEDVRPFDEIRAIQTAPQYVRTNGKVTPCRVYVVTFTDGSTWSTLNGPMIPRRQEWAQLAQSLSELSGVVITECAVLPG